MKRKLSLILTLVLISVLAFSLTACIKETGTLKSLKNEYGFVVDGGGFKEGSTLVSEEIGAATEEGARILSALADQSYNKDGSVYIFDIYVTKDGKKVQPDGKIKITIPNPGINWSDCVVFHIKSDNSVEEIIPTLSEDTITFEARSFSYFILAKKAECIHSLDKWTVTEEATCIKEGLQTRKCMLCGEVVLSQPYLADHEYGELIPEVSPTIFKEGVIAHYECAVCGDIFNESKEAVTSTSIEKLVPKISIYLDGEAVAEFTVDETTSGQITLSIADLEVTEGQLVTIRDTADAEVIYEYTVHEELWNGLGIATVAGNIDPTTRKIRTTSKSNVELVIGKDSGCTLSMDGYVHSGVVIEITHTFGGGATQLFPMNKVDYYDDPETQAYVFGLMGNDIYTSFRIIDLDTDAVYDYDDLSDTNAWDTWSYSRGANGEIAFAEGPSDWWLAFDIGGDGKITLTRHNLPSDVKPTITVFDGETIEMEKITLEVGSDEYKYYTWPLTDEAFSRQDEWLDTVDLDNITIYKGFLTVDAGGSFYIGDDYSRKPWMLLSTVYVEGNAIDKHTTTIKEGYYTKPAYGITLEKAGTYVIEYLPFCNVINIYEYEEAPDPHEHVYFDGKCECGAVDPNYVPDTPDPDYKGIVIEINGEKYAMNFVTYPTDEVNSYVYGYVYIHAGDKLLIRDTESGAVWGYDDIDERFGWNTWDYHRGENGEIVFDFAARYAFELDYDGCKKLYITKVFAPKHGESFSIDFDGERDDITLDSFDLSASAGAEGEFMWTLTHATTMNSSDFTEYINENGLCFYYAIIDLEEGESFSLKNLTTGGAIGADYMSDITGDIAAITRDGDLVSVQKSGSFYIIYLPAFNSFSIECDTTDPLSEINLYAGDKAVTLIPDEKGDIFYEGFESKTYHIISIDDARFSPLPIILDEAMDKSLIDLTVSGDYYTAYPNKEGIYNLRYNVYTGILYLEYVDSGEEEVSIPYQIYISYDNKLTLKENSENPDELCYLGLTLGAWDEFNVRDTELNYITDMTITEGSDVVTNGRTITVQVGGTFDFYINKTTHEVRIVVSEGGGAGGDVDYSDGLYLYLDSDFITVYPNEDGDVKYLGIAATDETSIAFLDKSYNYLSMTLDPASDSSIAKVYSANMLFFYKTGTANIIYNVNTGIISVEMTDISLAGAKVYMYLNGTTTTLTADESGIITYEGLIIESSSSILLTDSAFEYLPMILDPAMDTSLGSLYESGDMTMLIINGAGTYSLKYDLSTGVVLLETMTEA